MSSIHRAHTTRPAEDGFEDAFAFDWDKAVRAAFLEGCMREGVRADDAKSALSDGASREPEALLRERAKEATQGAALGWLKLETCLARYGELAAMSLARCLDEAELDIRREIATSNASNRRGVSLDEVEGDGAAAVSPTARSSQTITRCGSAVRVSIVQRARERLERFWQGNEFRAA
jgi:hypothetical protein